VDPGRRRALQLGLGGLILACRREGGAPDSLETGGGLACAPPEPGGPGWVEIALSDYPELAEVGGQAAVDLPDVYLKLIVAQPSQGCYLALWRICTHGACEVAWEPETDEVVCPCHGSRFSETGEVLEGPADRPLRAYPIARAGDALWISTGG